MSVILRTVENAMEEVEVVEVLEGGEGAGEAICANLNTSQSFGSAEELIYNASNQLNYIEHITSRLRPKPATEDNSDG